MCVCERAIALRVDADGASGAGSDSRMTGQHDLLALVAVFGWAVGKSERRSTKLRRPEKIWQPSKRLGQGGQRSEWAG